MRNLCWAVCTAMEGFLNRKQFDFFSFMPTTRASVFSSVHIGDSEAHCNRLRTTVHANEAREWARATGVTKFSLQSLGESLLTKGRRHDIGHYPVPRHCLNDFLGPVTCAKHAIASIVVKNCTVGGNDPWTSPGKRNVWIDGCWCIEINEIVLKDLHKVRFIMF